MILLNFCKMAGDLRGQAVDYCLSPKRRPPTAGHFAKVRILQAKRKIDVLKMAMVMMICLGFSSLGYSGSGNQEAFHAGPLSVAAAETTREVKAEQKPKEPGMREEGTLEEIREVDSLKDRFTDQKEHNPLSAVN